MAGDSCPIRRDPDDGGDLPCIFDECGWYDREAGVCAVLAISQVLRRLC